MTDHTAVSIISAKRDPCYHTNRVVPTNLLWIMKVFERVVPRMTIITGKSDKVILFHSFGEFVFFNPFSFLSLQKVAHVSFLACIKHRTNKECHN